MRKNLKAIIYIYILVIYGLAWKLVHTPIFILLALALVLVVGVYWKRYGLKGLIPGIIIVTLVLFDSNLSIGSRLPKVIWIKEYSETYRVAVVEGWKWIRIKEGEDIEVGDIISNERY